MQARLNPEYSHACLPAGVDILANPAVGSSTAWLRAKEKSSCCAVRASTLRTYISISGTSRSNEVTESDGSCTHSRIVIDATSDLGSLSVSESFLSLNSISFLPFSTLAHLGSAWLFGIQGDQRQGAEESLCRTRRADRTRVCETCHAGVLCNCGLSVNFVFMEPGHFCTPFLCVTSFVIFHPLPLPRNLQIWETRQ